MRVAGARAGVAREEMVLYTLAMPVSNRARFCWFILFFMVGITSACGDPPRTLRVAIRPWEETLNPLLTNNHSSRQIAASIYESLLKIDNEGNVIPGLARLWEWDSTGTVLTLTLHSGIGFHDGTPFDADVAVESLRRAAEPSAHEGLGPFSSVPFLLGEQTSMSVIDDSTMSIRLASPHASILRTLATPVLTPIMGAGEVKVSGDKFRPGTGRFRLTRFDFKRGLLILDRFEQYWGSQPQSQRIKFTAVSRSEDALQMLRNGKADLSLAISASEVSEVHSSESMALVAGPHVNYLVIGMNNQRPPFNIPEARRALAMGMDRTRLVEEFYKGAAEPTRSFIVRSLFPEITSPPAPKYNPEYAMELIESAVPPEYRTIKIIFPPAYSPGKQHWLHENLRYMLDPLGLQLQPLYTADYDEYTFLIDQRDWDISLDGMVSDNGDLFEFLYILYGQPSSAGGTGVFGINAEGLHNALETARSSLDSTERIRNYEKVLEIIAREIPCVPLCTRAHFLVRSTEVEAFDLGIDISRIFSDVRKKGWR